jgi:hypothetical protein
MCSLSSTGFAFPLACIVTWVPTASAVQQCLDPVVTSPARELTLSSVRPGITWEAVPGVSDYRLRLTSRQPEGRTFATIDTAVSGTRFVPPQAFTDGFAVVRVSVTSQCPAGAVPTYPPAAEHRFYIDARPTCQVGGLAVDAQAGHIAWTPTAGATRYEVFAFDAVDGRLLFKLDTREPHVIPASTADPAVVAVRAQCGEVLGQPSYTAY